MREETQAEKVKRWRVTVEASCYMPALGTEVSRIQSLPSRALVQLILLRTAGLRCTTEGRRMWSRYSMSPLTPNSTTPSCEPQRLHSAHAPHVCSSLWMNGIIVASGTQEGNLGTSLVVQWLRLHAPNAGGPASILGQGTKILHATTKSLHAATKTQCSQVNK